MLRFHVTAVGLGTYYRRYGDAPVFQRNLLPTWHGRPPDEEVSLSEMLVSTALCHDQEDLHCDKFRVYIF
jgi:hypothetical protein